MSAPWGSRSDSTFCPHTPLLLLRAWTHLLRLGCNSLHVIIDCSCQAVGAGGYDSVIATITTTGTSPVALTLLPFFFFFFFFEAEGAPRAAAFSSETEAASLW